MCNNEKNRSATEQKRKKPVKLLQRNREKQE